MCEHRTSGRGALCGIASVALVALCRCSCTDGTSDTFTCRGDPEGTVRPSHWGQESHCPDAAPDYDEVFGDDVVHALRIEISRQDHQATMDDMDEKFSGGSTLPDLDALPSPMYVPVTIRYGDQTWTDVGMRYKGHSSLKAAWQSGVRKLSFILNFDYYEDDHPELDNQRFFGFNKLSFSNSFNDPSLLREKVGGDIFRAGGVPAARSAFATASMDWGEGPTYLGLFTIVEDPCDEMLETQLGDRSGTLYKPWGDAARWLSVDAIGPEELAPYFEDCDDSGAVPEDVVAAIEALHAPRDDSARWRANLEELFDVRAFLRTLAINQVMVNWDSYGCMHHNYHVYANPQDGGRLLWFPWDLNESMLNRAQASCPPPGSVMLDEIVSPDPNAPEVDTDWPLIQLLLSDAQYRVDYRDELRAALDGPFAAVDVIARMRRYHDLIAPYVVGPEAVERYPYTNTSEDGFLGSLTSGDNALEPHVQARHTAVEAALGS